MTTPTLDGDRFQWSLDTNLQAWVGFRFIDMHSELVGMFTHIYIKGIHQTVHLKCNNEYKRRVYCAERSVWGFLFVGYTQSNHEVWAWLFPTNDCGPP